MAPDLHNRESNNLDNSVFAANSGSGHCGEGPV